MTKITEQLCGTSQVSELCQDLDTDINAWRERPLEQAYPYLIIDATYLYIRSGGQVASEGVLIVTGIAESGHRDILALNVAHTETEATYTSLFKDLKKRGLKGMQLIISAITKAYKTPSNDTFKNCQTHFHRNIRGITPPKYQREVADALFSMTRSKHRTKTPIRHDGYLSQTRGQNRPRCGALPDVFPLSTTARKRIRTTNLLERLNREIKRRADVVQIFPNEEACERLIGALCMEWSEEWIAGRRYLDMTNLKQNH